MDAMYSYDYQFRLIVVGDSTVGKVRHFDRSSLPVPLTSSSSPLYYARFVMAYSRTIP